MERSLNNKIIAILVTLVMVTSVFAPVETAHAAVAKKPGKVALKTVKATNITNSRMTVSFGKAKNAKKYQISYRICAKGQKWKTKTVKTRKAKLTGLKAGTKYCIKIRGINGKKKGAFTKIKHFVTKKTPVNINKNSDNNKNKDNTSTNGGNTNNNQENDNPTGDNPSDNQGTDNPSEDPKTDDPSEEQGVPVTSVTLSDDNLTLIANDTKSTIVTATVLPENADNKKLTWSSSDTNVAVVSRTGVVYPKRKGTCTITAMASNGVKATLNLTVKGKPIETLTLNIPKDSGFSQYIRKMVEDDASGNIYAINNGKTGKFEFTTNPSAEVDYDIVWTAENVTTGDDSEFTITQDGTITANTSEKRQIIVTATDKLTGVSDSREIWFNPLDVVYDSNILVETEDKDIKNEELGIWMGQEFDLDAMESKFGKLAYELSQESTMGYGDEITYVFDRNGTFKDYVEIIVIKGRIQGWFTNATEKFNYKGTVVADETRTEGIELLNIDNAGSNQSVVAPLGNVYRPHYYSRMFYNSSCDDKNVFSGIYRTVPVTHAKDAELIDNDRHDIYVLNALRVGSGTTQLVIEDRSLEPAVKVAADWWASRNKLRDDENEPHRDADGRTIGERLGAYGLSGDNLISCAENALLRGRAGSMGSVENCAQYWNSPGHKANMMHRYSEGSKILMCSYSTYGDDSYVNGQIYKIIK